MMHEEEERQTRKRKENKCELKALKIYKTMVDKFVCALCTKMENNSNFYVCMGTKIKHYTNTIAHAQKHYPPFMPLTLSLSRARAILIRANKLSRNACLSNECERERESEQQEIEESRKENKQNDNSNNTNNNIGN